MIDYCVHLVLVLNKGGYKSYLTMHALAVQSRNIKQSESEPVVLCEVDLPLCWRQANYGIPLRRDRLPWKSIFWKPSNAYQHVKRLKTVYDDDDDDGKSFNTPQLFFGS